MAINKKLIHFQKSADFQAQLSAGNILDTSIVFIKDAKQIYTHGQIYPCPYTLEELTALLNNKANLSKLDEYLTITDANNTFIKSIPVANGTTAGIVKTGGNVTISNGVITVRDNGHSHTINNITNLKQTLDQKVSTSRTINGIPLKTDITLKASDVGADASGSADTALANAKEYTDTEIAKLVGQAPEALNSVWELAAAMEDNQDAVDALNTAIGTKVDKVSGKGLSTNDYTTTEKNKLAGIAAKAEVNQNAFSNVTVGDVTISADSKTDTLTLTAGNNITITPNTSDDSIVIAAKDTTYSAASQSAAGLMSADDKKKLDGIATGANKYSLPNATSSTLGGVKIGSNITVSSGTISLTKSNVTSALGYTPVNSAASSDTSGLMSADDKAKLDSISNSADAVSFTQKLTSGTEVGTININGTDTKLYAPTVVTYSKMSQDEANTGTATSARTITAEVLNTTITNKIAGKLDSSTASSTYATKDALSTGLSEKVDKVSGKGLSTNDYTTNEKNKLSGIAAGAEVNQNAFANISDGTTTISADAKQDTLNVEAGSGVTLTLDATNDKLTIGHADTSTLSGAYGPTANVTGSNGKTIVVPQITVDGFGHVTGVTNRTYTSKDTTYSAITADQLNTGTDTGSKVVTAAVLGPWVKSQIDSKIAAADAMIYKGTIGTNGTITTLPDTTAKTGWTYKVITAGTYASQTCEVGDMIICLTDGSTSTAATWSVIQTNTDGHVTGPASSVNARVAVFNGTTGKLIKDSGFTIGKSVPSDAVFTDTKSFTITANASDDDVVVLSGTNGTNAVTYSASHAKQGPSSAFTSTASTKTSISGSGASGTINIPKVNVNTYGHVTSVTNEAVAITMPTLPTLSGLGGVGSVSATGTAPLTLSASKSGTDVTITGSVATMGAASSSADGSAGLVPAPTKGNQGKYLRADGTWATPTNTTYTQASLGQGYGTCSTAEATTAKAVTLSSYVLATGGIVSVKFTYAVPAGATMNINSKGAKAIYYKGAAITAGIIKAGDVATFIYDGTQYHLLSTDRTKVEISRSLTSGVKIGTVTIDGVGVDLYCRDNDTHWTTGINAGASGATSNSAVTNPYITVKDNSTYRSQIQLVGGGKTTVTSDASGAITISSTWRGITDSVSTTDSTISGSATAVKTAYDKAVAAYNLANGKTSNTGTVTSVVAGTGLNGGTITTTGTISVKYGTSAGTAAQGNDSRLSDARNPKTTTLSAEDLDNITTPGLYHGGGSNTVNNKPSGVDAFGLFVFKTASGYTTQELTEGNTNAGCRWTRQYTGSSWGSWIPMPTFSATPTSGQVVVTDGVTGKIKSSGYTIAKSVPSNAVFTDTKSFTITATATDDDVIVLTGTNGTNKTTYDAKHAKTFGNTTAPYSAKYTSGNTTTSISGSGGSGTIKIPQITVDEYGHVRAGADESVTITMPTLPTALKSPKALTAGSKSYDGSAAVEITAADLGLSQAIKYIGKTSTSLSDGSTTSSITIGSNTVTAKQGDVVIDSSDKKEYIWNGSAWEEFGNEGNYKVVQTAVTSPSASGNTTSFIDTISQDTQGKITATKKTVSSASTSAAGLMSANDKLKLDYTNVVYGTCSTAAATAAKEITVSGNTKWELKAGSIVVVKFSATNTAQNPTFNVNGKGAKSVWYGTAVITTSNLDKAGYANRPMMFMYDGTQYVFIGWSYDTNSTYSTYSLGIGYGTCSTAAGTTAKVVTLSNYTLVKGGIVSVKFDYAVDASSTMNINSKGAKAIYYKGAAIAANVIPAGSIATFIYDGTQYHLIGLDVLATHKHSVTVSGTTGGTTATGSIGNTTATGSIGNTKAGGTVGSKTAGGTVSSTFTGEAHNHTFTGSAVTSGAPSNTTSVYSITGVGTLPTLTDSYSNGFLVLTFGQGTLPSRSSVTLPANGHTHSVTAAGSLNAVEATGTVASTFTGTAHDHSFTGTDHNHSFTGTAHNHSFTGTSHTHSFSATPTTGTPTY